MGKDINWSMDITTKKKEPTIVIAGRVKKRYKEFIDKNKINTSKLIMGACEMLDNSLKKENDKLYPLK